MKRNAIAKTIINDDNDIYDLSLNNEDLFKIALLIGQVTDNRE